MKVNTVEVTNVNTDEIQQDEQENNTIRQLSVLKATSDNKRKSITTLDKYRSKVANDNKCPSGVHVTVDMNSELALLAQELNVKKSDVIDFLLNNRNIQMKLKYTNNPKKSKKVDVSNVNKDKLYELKDKYKLSSLEEVLWRLMNDYLV